MVRGPQKQRSQVYDIQIYKYTNTRIQFGSNYQIDQVIPPTASPPPSSPPPPTARAAEKEQQDQLHAIYQMLKESAHQDALARQARHQAIADWKPSWLP